jgi:asparagine synthase (glutamine-hydrolysing)
MCGVCGIVALAGEREVDLAQGRIDSIVKALAHRGPDDVGTARQESVLFGATRLTIRGPSGGRQPFRDTASGVMAVCNGEIDNSASLKNWLRDRGRPVADVTDVAVLPQLYLELGESFVEELVGAFALAIWDPRERCLLLARDRAGERPLFYTVENGLVRFATEIAALAQDTSQPLTPDLEALRGYLRFGSFASPQTPFREIRKVPPAGLVRIDAAGIRVRRYWRWRITAREEREPSLEAFDAVFREAVRRQSEADVGYGFFLSGGIDSSLVAAVARSLRPEVRPRAFTLRFAEQSYDEGSFAGQVAHRLGCEHVSVWVTPQDFPAGIAELVCMVGEPLADPAWVPTALLARRAAQDVKLALVGEGADELFAGYPTYIGAQVAQHYAALPHAVKGIVRRLVELWPPSDKKVTLSFLLKRFVAGAELDGIARHLLWTSNVPPALLDRLTVTGAAMQERPAASGEEVRLTSAEELGGGAALLDRIQRIDLETSLAEGLLTKADRASMRSALELRAPFLDRDVMTFATSLSPRQRVRGTRTKVFLKRYAETYLPHGIVHRKKRGLSVPLSTWIRDPLRAWAESRLGDPRLARAGVSPEAALAVFQEHCERKADHGRALWAVIVLDEWLRWTEESVRLRS